MNQTQFVQLFGRPFFSGLVRATTRFRVYGRDRILVLTTDDLADARAAEASMRRLEAFLGLPGGHDASVLGRRFNRAGPASMSPSLRRGLTELYRPHNERLERHLGRELHWH